MSTLRIAGFLDRGPAGRRRARVVAGCWRPVAAGRRCAGGGRRPGAGPGVRRRLGHGRRRRVEHGLPDQQGRPGGVTPGSIPRSPSSSTTTAPAAASAATCRARSTSSTPRAPAKPDEEAKAKAQGIEWTRFLVGYDGITVVVNPKNDFVKSLTVEQLKAIWAPGSKVKTWKDVDPVLARPQDRPLLPDNDSGTFEFFTEAIVGKAKSQRDDVQPAPTTTRSSTAWPATPTASATSATPTTRRTRTSSARSRSRTGRRRAGAAQPRDDRRQDVRSALPAALHLREELGAAAAGGRRVPQVLPREHRRRSPRRRATSPRRAEDKAANQKALAKLLAAATVRAEASRPGRRSKDVRR